MPTYQKTILLTGASGQLGRRLVPCLIKAGFIVRAHYRSAEKAWKYGHDLAAPVIGDLLNPAWLIDATAGCDIVIHAAAKVSLRSGGYDEQYKINVLGTKEVISACRKNNVKRLIYISSIVTVGASRNSKPIDESARFNLGDFDIPYIVTKREAEQLALKAGGPDFDVVSLNPSIMISPPDREITKADLKKIPRFIPAYFDFGLNVVETEDVIDGIIASLEKGQPGQRYLLTGENLTPKRTFELGRKYFKIRKPHLRLPVAVLFPIALISEIVAKIRGKRPRLYWEFARLARFRFIYSNKKARRELGFSPKPLEKTLENILSKIAQ